MSSWQPTDNQVVQLLLNRGHLDADRVIFARAQQLLTHEPSLLALLVEEGDVSPSQIEMVVRQARHDEMVRRMALTLEIITPRQLADAERLRRGTSATLLQTLMAEGYCTWASFAALKGAIAPTPPNRPAPRLVATPLTPSLSDAYHPYGVA